MPQIDLPNAKLPLVLALDIGTSSTRALLFDSRGWAIEGAECQLGFDMSTTSDGGADVDASMLLDLVLQSVDAIAPMGKGQIAAVGVSCFWHSVMGIDASDRPTTPVYLWADTRSREDVDDIKRQFDPLELWNRTGCFVHSSYWPGTLRWLARTEPDAFRATRTWCAFSDYLYLNLFGVRQTSVSMASSTALQNATSLKWDSVALSAAGVQETALFEIGNSRASLIELRPEFGARWPEMVGVPWYMAVGDGACANVGAGGVGPNRIALTIGTSGALRMVEPRARGEKRETPDSLWTYRLDEYRAVTGAAISNGGKVVEWLAELSGIDFDSEAMIAAGEMDPDSHGLTVLPFLAGERAPIWSDWVTGAVIGLDLATTPSDLVRAGMEAVSYRLALIYRQLKSQARPYHQIVANGGAILRSEPWLQMLADITEHEIVALLPEEESSARGAALLALEYAGIINSMDEADDPVSYGRVITPVPGRADIYHEAMNRQQRLLDALYLDGKPRI